MTLNGTFKGQQALRKVKKKTAFRRDVIVSLTCRFYPSILHLKLIFILMWAFLLITIQDHTWWVMHTHSFGCQSRAITGPRRSQTVSQQQLVEETWQCALALQLLHQVFKCFLASSALVCVCVRACGPHRLRHPGQRPQFVLGCHMPGSDGSAVDPAVAAHPAPCEAAGTAGARDDGGEGGWG